MRSCLTTWLLGLLLVACAPSVSRPQDSDYSLEDLIFEVVPGVTEDGLEFTAYVTNVGDQMKILERGTVCASMTIRAYPTPNYEGKPAWDGVVLYLEEPGVLSDGTVIEGPTELFLRPCPAPAFILETHPGQKYEIFTQYYTSEEVPIRGTYYFTAQLNFAHWKEGRFSPLYTEEIPSGSANLDW
jgi:hypothetical protein